MKASRCACNSINVRQYTSAQFFFLLKNKKDCADIYCVTLIEIQELFSFSALWDPNAYKFSVTEAKLCKFVYIKFVV